MDGRQARTGGQGVGRPAALFTTPTRLLRSNRAGAAEEAEAHREGETGHHDAPSCLGHDPPTRIAPLKEGLTCWRFRHYPDRSSLLHQSRPLAKRHKKSQEGPCFPHRNVFLIGSSQYERSNSATASEISLWIRRISNHCQPRRTFLMDAAPTLAVDAENSKKPVVRS